MGTQWPGMAKQLMNLEVFANSIRRSAQVLKPHGIDLISLVTNGVKDTTNARSIIPAFVSIAAVQVMNFSSVYKKLIKMQKFKIKVTINLTFTTSNKKLHLLLSKPIF